MSILLKHKGKRIYFESLTWSGTDTQCSREMSFTLPANAYRSDIGVPKLALGDVVCLYDGAKQLMAGVVTTREKSAEVGTFSYTAQDFMSYLANTLKLSVFGLLWGFPAPIILAFLLNRIQSKGIKKKVQLALYLPNFISVIVLCGIVRIFLSVTGPVNLLLGTQINFMTMPGAWRTIYIASGIWQGAGWASIMYTAALASASQDLTEAAVLDGANIFQQIKVVEWPAIKDIVIIQFILQAGNIMSVGFEKAYALQTDLNLASSEIISTYVYKQGLISGNFSFSTAVGLFNTIINVILLVSVNKIVAKMNEGQGL